MLFLRLRESQEEQSIGLGQRRHEGLFIEGRVDQLASQIRPRNAIDFSDVGYGPFEDRCSLKFRLRGLLGAGVILCGIYGCDSGFGIHCSNYILFT